MNAKTASFVTSVADPSHFLKRPIPHFVFCGRSNVGKSSILNKLLNRKSLAKTSQTPGKTRLINYFLVDDRLFFVDLPGYGYAQVSKKERAQWQTLIEAYLTETPFIALVFQLIDIRHDPTPDDLMMIDWLKHYQKPFLVLLTKADKLKRGRMLQQRQKIARQINCPENFVIPTSASTSAGTQDVWRHIAEAYQLCNAHLNSES